MVIFHSYVKLLEGNINISFHLPLLRTEYHQVVMEVEHLDLLVRNWHHHSQRGSRCDTLIFKLLPRRLQRAAWCCFCGRNYFLRRSHLLE